jgi:hypothetical protein
MTPSAIAARKRRADPAARERENAARRQWRRDNAEHYRQLRKATDAKTRETHRERRAATSHERWMNMPQEQRDAINARRRASRRAKREAGE